MRVLAFLCMLAVLALSIRRLEATATDGKPLIVNASEVVDCDGGCWVPFLAPERTCKCVVPKCTQQFSGDCQFCQRGVSQTVPQCSDNTSSLQVLQSTPRRKPVAAQDHRRLPQVNLYAQQCHTASRLLITRR